MVKNSGGNKAKKSKNSGTSQNNIKREIQIPDKDDNSHIAIIKKVKINEKCRCFFIQKKCRCKIC